MKLVKTKTGFTLIELLVVVAIIAVLVAILLPTLSEARRKAKAIQCLSRLQQIGRFWGCYWTDNRDYIPPIQDWWNWGGTPGPSGQWWSLPNTIQPAQRPLNYIDTGNYAYVNVKELFICPSDNENGICWSIDTPVWWHLGTSYANNPFLVKNSGVPRQVTAIPEPSRWIFLGDTTMFAALYYPSWTPGLTWHDRSGDLKNNVLFFDGHASFVSVMSCWTPGSEYKWYPEESWK